MEFRQLRYFVAVVDAGSITRACDSLHVVQSAVSHQLRLLEEEMGSALLIRSVTGVSPTAAGQVLYREARAILKQVADVRTAVSVEDGRVSGAVSIGIASSTAQLCAVPLLSAVRKAHPEVVLSIHEGISSALTDALVAGKLDLAVVYASDATERLDSHHIVREPFYFTTADAQARRDYAGRHDLALAELARWPLLLPSTPNGTRSALDKACARADVNYRIVGEVNSPMTQCASVLAGLGSTVLPWVSLHHIERRDELLALPLVDPEVYRDVVVVQASASPSRATEVVRQLAIRTLTTLHADIETPAQPA